MKARQACGNKYYKAEYDGLFFFIESSMSLSLSLENAGRKRPIYLPAIPGQSSPLISPKP
jgi:hypothetical protein